MGKKGKVEFVIRRKRVVGIEREKKKERKKRGNKMILKRKCVAIKVEAVISAMSENRSVRKKEQ